MRLPVVVSTLATAATLLVAARPAAAVERLFNAAGAEAPAMDDAREVLFVARYDVEIGQTCGGGGGDAGVPDAGVPGASDAGCEPVYGDAISMFLQPRFSTGPDGARFALLVVTPGPAAVRTEPSDTFTELAALTATEVLVEEVVIEDPALGTACGARACGEASSTDSSGCGGYDPDWRPPDDDPELPGGDAGVAPEMIGSYEVVRLPATDAAGVAAWLDAFGYVYQQADLDAVAPYLAAGWSITALRVAVASSPDGDDGALEPLSFTWAGSEIRLPLGLLPGGAEETRLTTYVYAIERRDWALGEVEYAWRVAFVGDGFLTKTEMVVGPSSGPDDDPVATVVPGDPMVRDTRTVVKEIRVPVDDCGSDGAAMDDDSGGCCRFAGRRGLGRELNFVLLGAATLLAVRRRRRPARAPDPDQVQDQGASDTRRT